MKVFINACLLGSSLIEGAVIYKKLLRSAGHEKPWNGIETTVSDRSFAFSGLTAWKQYELEGQINYSMELLVDINTDIPFSVDDRPEWFVALPSNLDDPEGIRDYIIIRSYYEAGTELNFFEEEVEFKRQIVEYYQSKDPSFEAVDGTFNFSDDGLIYSKQTADVERERGPPADNGFQAAVWSVTNAAFTDTQISLAFSLKPQTKLTILEIPTRFFAKVGFAMAVDPENDVYIGRTKDVIISWAPSPIAADYSNIEPNEYIAAGAEICQGLLGSSLVGLLVAQLIL